MSKLEPDVKITIETEEDIFKADVCVPENLDFRKKLDIVENGVRTCFGKYQNNELQNNLKEQSKI